MLLDFKISIKYGITKHKFISLNCCFKITVYYLKEYLHKLIR